MVASGRPTSEWPLEAWEGHFSFSQKRKGHWMCPSNASGGLLRPKEEVLLICNMWISLSIGLSIYGGFRDRSPMDTKARPVFRGQKNVYNFFMFCSVWIFYTIKRQCWLDASYFSGYQPSKLRNIQVKTMQHALIHSDPLGLTHQLCKDARAKGIALADEFCGTFSVPLFVRDQHGPERSDLVMLSAPFHVYLEISHTDLFPCVQLYYKCLDLTTEYHPRQLKLILPNTTDNRVILFPYPSSTTQPFYFVSKALTLSDLYCLIWRCTVQSVAPFTNHPKG